MIEYGTIGGMKTYLCETVVLGSGAAGYNAADLLRKGFVDDLCIVTEGKKCGTSRNTGSDKQTYYKLSLAGGDSDSVREMAGDLFRGRCVDGDIALCEAALSTASFMRLCDLGVPFPTNRYGEYIGYKTDHDPHRRATSVGPYTSKLMTDYLEHEAEREGVELLDGYQLVRILQKHGEVRAIIVMSRKDASTRMILTRNLVLATGGPAGIYQMSVYPESQFGATGIALEAGCQGKNLTEWQYGLASLKPRWNVSGSYMQVIPRFVSIDADGNEYDFLSDYRYTRAEMLSRVFLKGYQWPFDVRKLETGSSIVDILCYLEIEKGRRVYLDYMHNPDGKELPWAELSEDARTYLEKSGATGILPIDRLKQMNTPAYEFYREKGVDLEKQYLEIGLCAQHNNGGLSIDSWWQSNIEGIFPVGEVAASHGVYRPGGTALNAGQCGSRRAASWILEHRIGEWCIDATGLDDDAVEIQDIIDHAMEGSINAEEVFKEVRTVMSLSGSAIRNRDSLVEALQKVEGYLSSFNDMRVDRVSRIWILFELRNALITQKVYLSAMLDYLENEGLSRGSALYSDMNGEVQVEKLDDRFRYSLEDEDIPSKIQEVILSKDGSLEFSRRDPRPIPEDEDFFERVWASYRKNKNVY